MKKKKNFILKAYESLGEEWEDDKMTIKNEEDIDEIVEMINKGKKDILSYLFDLNEIIEKCKKNIEEFELILISEKDKDEINSIEFEIYNLRTNISNSIECIKKYNKIKDFFERKIEFLNSLKHQILVEKYKELNPGLDIF